MDFNNKGETYDILNFEFMLFRINIEKIKKSTQEKNRKILEHFKAEDTTIHDILDYFLEHTFSFSQNRLHGFNNLKGFPSVDLGHYILTSEDAEEDMDMGSNALFDTQRNMTICREYRLCKENGDLKLKFQIKKTETLLHNRFYKKQDGNERNMSIEYKQLKILEYN